MKFSYDQTSEYVVPGAYVWLLNNDLAFVVAVNDTECLAYIMNSEGRWSDIPSAIPATILSVNGYPPHEDIRRYHEELVGSAKLPPGSEVRIRTLETISGATVEQALSTLD